MALNRKNATTVDLKTLIAKKSAESKEFASAYAEAWAEVELSRALAALREKQGISQAEMAKKMRTSQQAISRLESPNYTGHSMRQVTKYAGVLGFSPKVVFQANPSAAMAHGGHRVTKKSGKVGGRASTARARASKAGGRKR